MPIDSVADLQTFVAIVEAGSFTAAAQRQGLTVNAVSRRLRQLEQSLGARLVERTTRSSSPTEAGRRLHQKALAILDAVIDAEGDVQQSGSVVEGLVRVALPAAVISRPFLAHLEQLLRTHSRLRVDVRVGSRHLPGEAGVDVAVVVGAPPDSLALVGRRLGTHRWALAAAPAYVKLHGLPAEPAELSRHACLRFRGELPQETWTLSGPRGRRVEVKVDGRFECDDSRVLGDATYAGLGIGVRPESEVIDAVARKSLVHVLPGWRFGVQAAHVLTTVGRRGLPRIAAVTEVISAAIRGLK